MTASTLSEVSSLLTLCEERIDMLKSMSSGVLPGEIETLLQTKMQLEAKKASLLAKSVKKKRHIC